MTIESGARTCDRIVAGGLGALVVFAPLAFGSVETWAQTILVAAVFLVAAVWVFGRSLRRDRRLATGLEAPVVIFLGVVLLQILPLPRPLLAVVSPRTVALYARTIPGYSVGPANDLDTWLLASDSSRGELSPPAGAGGALPASYSVTDTIEKSLLFAAYALVFLIVADYFRDRGRFRRFLVFLSFTGIGVAVLGILQKLTWNGKVLWIRDPGPNTRPFGPFVNPNHFAGYMELVVPLLLSLLLTLLSGRAQFAYRFEGGATAGGDRGLGRTFGPGALQELEGLPWMATSRGAKAVLLGFLLALSVGSIVLSLSRGGFVATLVTFALFAPALAPPVMGSRPRPAKVAVLIAALLLVLLLGYWMGASSLAERAMTLANLRSEPSYLQRIQAWRGSLSLFADHLPVGAGLGTFETAFAGYYPPGTYGIWKQAHNDYLQLLAEVGIAGVVPALVALVVFARRSFLPCLRQRRSADFYLRIGLAMAIVSMLLHSLVDFSLQIPAVGFLFVVTGGLLAAATSVDPGTSPVSPRRDHGAGLIVCAVFLGLLSMAVAVLGGRKSMAEHIVARAASAAPAQGLTEISHAMSVDVWDPEPASAFGDRVVDWIDALEPRSPQEIQQAREWLDRAERAYRRVIAQRPLAAWGWWGLGEVAARRSHLDRLAGPIALEGLLAKSESDLGREARVSIAAVRTALLLEPNDYRLFDELAGVYADEGMRASALEAWKRSSRLMPYYERHNWGWPGAMRDDLYRAVVEGMDEALEDPEMGDEDSILRNLGGMAEIRGDLPEAERRYRLALSAARTRLMSDVLASVLGEVLRREGKISEAGPFLESAARSPVVGWSALVSLARIQAARSDARGALGTLRKASSVAPRQAWIDVVLAREMAQIGERSAAIARLRATLGREPGELEGRALLVELLRDEGELREALREAEALVALNPSRRDYASLLESIRQAVGEAHPGGDATSAPSP